MSVRTKGHLRFRRWVDSVGGQTAAAGLIESSQPNVSEIYRGDRTPRLDLLLRIRDVASIALERWAEPVSDEQWLAATREAA